MSNEGELSFKAYELSTLTGTQVMLLVASETGHVYTYATEKLKPIFTSESGKSLIQSCLAYENQDEGNQDQNQSNFVHGRNGKALGFHFWTLLLTIRFLEENAFDSNEEEEENEAGELKRDDSGQPSSQSQEELADKSKVGQCDIDRLEKSQL